MFTVPGRPRARSRRRSVRSACRNGPAPSCSCILRLHRERKSVLVVVCGEMKRLRWVEIVMKGRVGIENDRNYQFLATFSIAGD